MSDDAPFLSRWARRKAQARSGRVEPEAVPVAEAPPASPAARAESAAPSALVAPAAPSAPDTAAAPTDPVDARPALPTLDDVARLTRSSDYSPFVQPGVDSSVKNAALKKLFSDPHFNVMDGLDTYIDDYGKPDPIPLSMLRKMRQAHVLGLFADEDEKNAATAELPSVPPDGGDPAGVAESTARPTTDAPPCESEPRPDDDTDL